MDFTIQRDATFHCPQEILSFHSHSCFYSTTAPAITEWTDETFNVVHAKNIFAEGASSVLQRRS